MADIAGFINGLNQFTQTMGAIQGAAEMLAPAVNSVGQSVNQIASVFTGDTYQPYPYPTYPVYPPMPVGSLQEGKVGLIGSMLSGGAAGALTHKQTGESIKSIRAGNAGAWQGLGMASLKAGGIGAAVSGVVSAAKNISLTNKGMQSGADAASNIAADTIGGLLTGATGGIAAGAASLALGSVGGIGATIGIVAAGAIGAAGVNMLYDMSGLRDGIANKLRGAFGGQPTGYYPQPNQGYYPQPNQGYYPGYGY